MTAHGETSFWFKLIANCSATDECFCVPQGFTFGSGYFKIVLISREASNLFQHTFDTGTTFNTWAFKKEELNIFVEKKNKVSNNAIKSF